MNLLSVQGRGAVYLIFLFLLCVLLVHLFKLARIGYRTLEKKLPPEEPKSSPPSPEPVYFLVERKKKRKTPASYETPKEIQFR